MEGGAVRQNPRVRPSIPTSPWPCMRPQDIAQKTVRALFSEIECNGSAKTLSGKLFQCWVIDYEPLQKIRRTDCDTEANAVLAEHLYETGTEKTLQEFARVLRERPAKAESSWGADRGRADTYSSSYCLL